MREGVRLVEKRAVEGLGRGGWISRWLAFGVEEGVEEEMLVGGGGGDVGVAVGVEEAGAGGRREALGAGLSFGGEDGTRSRGFFVVGKGRVGDGELDRKGRLKHGELVISGKW